MVLMVLACGGSALIGGLFGYWLGRTHDERVRERQEIESHDA